MKKEKNQTEFVNVRGELALKGFGRNSIKRIMRNAPKKQKRELLVKILPLYHIGAFTPEQIKSGRLFYRGQFTGCGAKWKKRRPMDNFLGKIK